MTELKSLAHPDWPYAGTAHEWRGFVKKFTEAQQPLGPEATKILWDHISEFYIYQKQNFGPDLD